VNFVADVTSKGDWAVIVQFEQFGQHYPMHRQFLLLWHSNDFARDKSWTMLNALCGGNAAAIRGAVSGDEQQQAFKIAEIMSRAYQAGKIPQIDTILLLPNKKTPKYNDLISWGYEAADLEGGE
jgi:hypothetical protein